MALDCREASRSKASVPTVTVGMPRFSSSTEAWIHHAVQLPQSAEPTSTQSAFSTNSSMTAGSAAAATDL